VRTPSTQQPAVFRAPELFSSDQSELASRLVAGAKLRGVVIGALVGGASWDLRPVVLDRGRTVILRFSDPDLSNDSVRQSSLEGYLARLSDIRGIDGFASSALMQGRVWFVRPYFAKVLSDGFDQNVQLESDAKGFFAQTLIKQLAALHDAGLIHGHICASNVGIDANIPALLDFGFGAIQRAALVKTVDSVNEDTRALAEVINSIFGGALPPEVRPLIEKLLRSDVWDRPTLAELLQSFDSRGPHTARSPQSGRIIDATTSPQFQPPAIRLENRVETEQAEKISNKPKSDTLKTENNESREPSKSAAGVELTAKGEKSRTLDLTLVVAAIGLIYFAIARGYISVPRFFAPTVSQNELESRWASAQPSQMAEVARLAVLEGDLTAQSIVVRSALTGTAVPGVRSDLIKIGFDPRWEQDLTSSDRRFLLTLALAGFLKGDLPPLEGLASRHPAVVLAIAATLPLTSTAPELDEISTQSLAGLPLPIGTGFEILSKSGATELSSAVARSYATLVAGSQNAAAVRALFPDNLESLPALLRLSAVLPLCKQRPDLAAMIRQALSSNPNMNSAVRAWFAEDEFGVWKGVSDSLVLSIATGDIAAGKLVFQQLVDLVSYPLRATREAAIAEIGRTTVDESVLRVLAYLSHQGSNLTRSSILSLMTLLQLPSEQARPFVLKWFSQKPDAKGVTGVLLARSRVAQGDFFNFEAARYLDRLEDWKPSIAELSALSMHSEVQARALAYARLSITVPSERAVLEQALSHENSDKLRLLLRERLGVDRLSN